MHWYQLGLAKAARTPWVCLSHDITAHPDTAGEVTGHFVPDIAGMRAMVEDAHAKMLPGVPLAGWDIALTEEHGACLLEANLSCNFFRGTFELDEYLQVRCDAVQCGVVRCGAVRCSAVWILGQLNHGSITA